MSNAATAEVKLADEPNFALGGFAVRPSTREIFLVHARFVLEPRVMQVLTVLAQAEGRIVSRDELIDRCWGGRIVTENALTRVISRVRRLSELDEGRSFTLETIARVGYGLRRTGQQRPAPTNGDLPDTNSSGDRFRLSRRTWLLAGGAAAGVASFGGAAWWLTRTQAQPIRIAVLPFDAPDPVLRVQATGIADDLISALAAVPALSVVARASSFELGQSGKADAARRLGATHLLDGAVQRRDGHVTISVYLVDGGSGTTLWSNQYRPSETELPLIQERIVRDVTGVLRLTVDDHVRMANVDPVAYRLFLDGRNLVNGYPGDPAGAIPLLRQAVARAPSFSRAWSTLGSAYLATEGSIDVATYTSFERVEARAAAKRALALDPTDGDALAVLAASVDRAGHWADIRGLLDAALRHEPSNINVLYTAGNFYADIGWRERAIALLDKTRELDPLTPEATFLMLRVLEAEKGRSASVDHALADAQGRWPSHRSLWRFRTRRSIWQSDYPLAERLIAGPPSGAEGDAAYFADLLAGMRDPGSPRIQTFVKAAYGGPLPYTWPIFIFALGMLDRTDDCVAFIRRVYLSPWGRRNAPTWVLDQAMVRDAVAAAGTQDVLRQIGLIAFWKANGRG